MRNYAYTIIGALCLVFGVTSGQSQTPAPAAKPGAPAAPAPKEEVVPEVVVLGEALPDAQDKPVSASLLIEDDVVNFRIHEPQDILRWTPNQSATDSGSRSFGDVYSVRGLTNTVFFGAPATTIYVDDVPFGETFTYAQSLMAVNSVEVLRGPQPTVVGRNTYGGLINIRSRKPTNEYEGALDYSYGSYEHHDGEGYVMGPIVKDALFFRLGGQFDSREGYLRNPTLDNKRVDDQQHWGLQGGLFWKPADGWEVSLTGGYDEYNDGAPRLTALDRKHFYEVNSDVDGAQHRKTDNEALRISYENDAWRFLSVTSRRKFDLNPYTTDLDFTADPFGDSTIKQDQEIWSQEFRFSSNNAKSPFQWNVGAYGSTSEIHGSGLRHINTQQQTITQTDITAETSAGINQQIAGFFPFPVTVTIPRVVLTSVSDSDIHIEQLTTHKIEEQSLAFFAGGSWSGWEPVTLHAGVRVDWIHRELSRDKTSNIDAFTHTTFEPLPTLSFELPYIGTQQAPLPTPEPLDTRTTLKERSRHQEFSDDWVHVTPTLGIDVKVTDEVMLYAKSTYAFKPGGFSAYVDDPRFVRFEEERVWASEAGVKTQWMGGKIIANVAAFYNDIDNYQVERSIGVTDYAVFNAAKAETYGVEMETRAELLPQLDFLGSFGWTHARLSDYTDPVTGRNLDGKTPPFVPEFDASLALDFHLRAGFFVRGEYLILGETKFDDFNREEFKQGSFGLVNAMIGWRGGNWSIAFYGTNLAEEEYYTNMNTDIRTGAPGIPREFGVRVGVKF